MWSSRPNGASTSVTLSRPWRRVSCKSTTFPIRRRRRWRARPSEELLGGTQPPPVDRWDAMRRSSSARLARRGAVWPRAGPDGHGGREGRTERMNDTPCEKELREDDYIEVRGELKQEEFSDELDCECEQQECDD
mmetsp:Transcript_100304/g.288143  ORF Transcript_100304/g.288143 Transcript_100304/m.288143 type:complete len:135 (-) Transcript_100304:1433-1837(-)